VRGNTITKPATVVEAEPIQFGIHMIVGSEVGDKGTSCLDVGGATSELKNNLTSSSSKEFPDIRFNMNGEATAQLAGYTGGANDEAAVESYLAGRNTAPEGVHASQFDTTSKYAQVASCPLP
jgi:hypothetical protein